MENQFNLTNIRDFPGNEFYLMLHFSKPGQADYFEALMKKEGHFYERTEIEGKTRTIDAFAVRKSEFDKVKKLNYLALGKFRNRFIPDKSFRIIIISISILIMLLAVLGAIFNS